LCDNEVLELSNESEEHAVTLEPFKQEVVALTSRLAVNAKAVPLGELESGAKSLEKIAQASSAVHLARVSNRLAGLAKTAAEMSFPVSLSVLDTTFKALERADTSENLDRLESELEGLEEEAFLYTPPLGALNLDPTPVVEVQTDEAAGGLRRILSVDDSGLVRSALRRIFSESGAGVEECRNGTELLERLKEIGKFDLVLLDLQMPDYTGLELLPHIRHASQDVVVVMLTAAGDVKTAIEAMRIGADGFLAKQDLPLEGDRSEFYYALEQAKEYRAGIIARQQLESMKADLYSMVTHDLKNPANVIGLSLEHILDNDTSNLSDEQQKAIRVGKDAAEKLQRLVMDYLDYAKIDAGYFTLEPNPTDIAALVRSSSEQARVIAENKGQKLTLNSPDKLETIADEPRLKQVVDNLISNAIKYTPEDGLIHVALTTTGALFRISISDTGNGIAPDHLPRLFKKYQRLPGEQRRSTGTGLGLVIVKSIIEAHGGRVWAESGGVGEGSTFTLEIPVRHS
jgi:signal transduction histidine kinase